MRETARGMWAAALASAVVAGLAGCTTGNAGGAVGSTAPAAGAVGSTAPAVAKACADGTFSWSGTKRTDRLTGVSAPDVSDGRTIDTPNPIERLYITTLAGVVGESWSFTDVHQKAPNLDNRFSKVSGPGAVVEFAAVREWEGDFRHTCPGGRTTTGHARNWTVDLQGSLSCDESVDTRIARQAARRSCEPGSPATRNA